MIRNYTFFSKHFLLQQSNILTKAKSNNLKISDKNKLLGIQRILSKSTTKISDAEFKEMAIKQAQIDASKGIFQGDDLKSLRDSYISVVSPDRKSIIKSALLKSSVFPTSIKHSSGSPTSGFEIASYSLARGWEAVGTRAELNRSTEISEIYNEAWNKAYFGNDKKESSNAYDRVILENSGFNKKA